MERSSFLIFTVQAFETEYQKLKRSLFSGGFSPLTGTTTIPCAWTLTPSSITLDRYHIYRDFTGFAYNIILVRPDVLRNSMERCILKVSLPTVQSRLHTAPAFRHIYPSPFINLNPNIQLTNLQLCSTLETPKGYTSLMIHHVPGKDPETVHLTNKRCDWFTALAAFEKAFKDSTKVDWDDRQKVESADEDAFEYARPKMGAPVGFLINDVFCR